MIMESDIDINIILYNHKDKNKGALKWKRWIERSCYW
jgi:hypothetical protein